VPGIHATPYEDNFRYFNVVIEGPESSPYQRKCTRMCMCGNDESPSVCCVCGIE